MLRARFTGLWHHPDFLKLWAGQTISLFGSQVSLLALPLAAALTLGATPAQMGILGAAQQAPYLLMGLFAGVWVDRRRRRPILIAAELGRGVLMGSIPVVALLGLLTIEYLYVVTVLAGVLSVFFDVAYESYLPSLVRRDELLEGNSKLELSRSVALISAPGLGGGLVQLITAPITIAADAVSFLVSGILLGRIRTTESTPAPAQGRSWKEEIRQGLRLVLGNPVLRAIGACAGTSNFFNWVQLSVLMLYLTRDLDVSPGIIGVIFAAGNLGALLGALLAGATATRFGIGPTILVASGLIAASRLLIPLASGSTLIAVSLLIASQLLIGLGRMLYNINTLSVRQATAPHELQGRANASLRFVAWSLVPIGSLLGGALGETIGVWETLVVGALGGLLSLGWVLLSPVRRLGRTPDSGGQGIAVPA